MANVLLHAAERKPARSWNVKVPKSECCREHCGCNFGKSFLLAFTQELTTNSCRLKLILWGGEGMVAQRTNAKGKQRTEERWERYGFQDAIAIE